MTKLSVNINKVATLRNARGGNIPDLCQVALDCERFGAEGITVHPRPDERHIRYADVRELGPLLSTEFNIEGYPSSEFIKLVTSVRPQQVTLVPDPPEALTSNAGWDTFRHQDFLSEVVNEFQRNGIRVSIFVDTELKNTEYAAKTGCERVELYTEAYARLYKAGREKAIQPFIKAAELARSIGLQVNAGHDLSLENLAFLQSNIPWISEVSIGHALISDALYLGLEESIRQYKQQLSRKLVGICV